MGKAWTGRHAQQAKAYCQRVYGFTCWLCGRPIDPDDYSVDHIIERSKDASLTWDPDNWRPAHGRKHVEWGCPGNYGRSGRRTPMVRPWVADGW